MGGGLYPLIDIHAKLAQVKGSGLSLLLMVLDTGFR